MGALESQLAGMNGNPDTALGVVPIAQAEPQAMRGLFARAPEGPGVVPDSRVFANDAAKRACCFDVIGLGLVGFALHPRPTLNS